MLPARVGEWWVLSDETRHIGRFRYWCDAIRHAVIVTAQKRRGEPTA